jgi:CRISPR/Cas system CMR-associated protein Cmr5 small subunit
MDLDQLRAHHAFTYVQGLQGDRSDFLTLARKLPFMLHTNGLLATWAHLLAKKKARENGFVLQALSTHLRAVAARLRLDVPSAGDAHAIFDRWVSSQGGLTGFALRKNTAEALALSLWLKRAAEALCDTGETKPPTPTAQTAGAGEPPLEGPQS